MPDLCWGRACGFQQTNLLLDERLSGANTALAPNREVLYAAAWIVGEYSEYVAGRV